MSLAKAMKAKKVKRRFFDGGDGTGDGIGGVGTGFGETSGIGPAGDSLEGIAAAGQIGQTNGLGVVTSYDNGNDSGRGYQTGENEYTSPQGTPINPGAIQAGLGLLGPTGALLGIVNNIAGNPIGGLLGQGSGAPSDSPTPEGSLSEPTGTTPFGASTPAQTTSMTGAAPAAATGTGQRQYVWDQATHTYVLQDLGAQDNPMGYSQGQVFHAAKGGPVPSGIAAGLSPRLIDGPGTGLSDSIPVQMDDGKEGRLGRGEFVISADVVSGLGGGSTEAGAAELYKMMERIRKQAHGSKQQVRPVNPQSVLPA